MVSAIRNWRVEFDGDVMVLIPLTDLGEAFCQHFEEDAVGVLDDYLDSGARHMIVDLHATQHFSSAALNFLLKIHRGLQLRDGRLALCRASESQIEALHITRFSDMWPICGSRAGAIRAVRSE